VLETEARVVCQRLASEEGIFAGTSTGINVLAAIELAKELGSTATVVTVACDSGLKYTNGVLFNSSRSITS
jgi:cysteine synthase